MEISGRLLWVSERVYRWLVGVYPKEFRSEYGQEMVQAFRDRCREELSRGRISGVIGLWAHTILDFAVTVPIEYMKKGKSMNTVDKDLRWDVRYGFQMLFKHGLILVKYSAWASGVLLSLLLAALLGGLLASTLAVRYKEKPLNEAWKRTSGHTPDEFVQLMISRFPKTGMNDVASKVEVLTTKLGIFDPMPGRVYQGQSKERAGLLRSLDVPPYLGAQMKKSDDDLDEIPEEIRNYLEDHRGDLDTLYSLVLQNQVPRWEMDITRWVEAPLPSLFYHLQLHGVIALDVLAKTRLGQNREALRAFEASWKINQGLFDRPELLSQLVAHSILNRQVGVLRKMKDVPSEWQTRILDWDLQAPFLQAIGFDAVAASKYLGDTNKPVNLFGWADTIINSSIGQPFRRLMSVQTLEVANEILSKIRTSDFCSFDPDSARDQLYASLSRWNVGGNLINDFRAWKGVTRSLVNLELTGKILQVKATHPTKNEDSLRKVADIPSKLCSDAKWVHQVRTDGTILIACTKLPEWINRETTRFDLPLTYLLKPARQNDLR
jgi:hypothetical protein